MKEKTLQYFEKVKEIYADARPNSRRLHEEACKYMPGAILGRQHFSFRFQTL